ncbi:unnamed protein product, partial [Amoebophrya sp. A120]
QEVVRLLHKRKQKDGSSSGWCEAGALSPSRQHLRGSKKQKKTTLGMIGYDQVEDEHQAQATYSLSTAIPTHVQ